jgi:hypothetical protein
MREKRIRIRPSVLPSTVEREFYSDSGLSDLVWRQEVGIGPIEYIREDPVASDRNNVFHSKSTYQYLPERHYIGGPNPYVAFPDGYNAEAPTTIPSFISSLIPPNPLNWNKLPTSSKFGIIQFFAELDETLLMLKDIRSVASYGGVQWGILPFVSEMKALYDTVSKAATTDLSKIPYEDELSGQLFREVPFGSSGYAVEGEYTLRYSGHVSLDHIDPILRIYDQIGFHPTISTAWDLVPLSFAVDWFLPVGKYLDGLNEDGWIRTASFTGWRTLKATYRYGYTSTTDGCCPYLGPVTVYSRHLLRGYLLETFDPPVWSKDYQMIRQRPKTVLSKEEREHQKLIRRLKRELAIKKAKKEGTYNPWDYVTQRADPDEDLINPNAWVPPSNQQWFNTLYLGFPSFKKLVTEGGGKRR